MVFKQRRFDQLPIFGYFFRKFDRRVKKLGLQPAMMELIKKTKAKFKIKFLDKETKKILATKPVLLVANHPFEAEIVALTAALPQRKDIFIIMTCEFLSMGKNFSKYMIPVYLSKNAYQQTKKLLGRLLKSLKMAHNFSDKTAHQKNINNIKLAAEKIKQGHLVMLFPEGLRRKKRIWFPGVGHLINNLPQNIDAFYIKAHINGSSRWCALRRFIKVGWLFPKIQVTFAPAVSMKNILAKKLAPKKLASYLEKDYFKWERSIIKK